MLNTLDRTEGSAGGIRLVLTIFAIGASLLAGCQSPRARFENEIRALESDPLSDSNKVVAEVNGHVITSGEYYRRILAKFGSTRMLRGMIREDLFLQEAKKRNLSVKPEAVKARVDDLVAQDASRAGGKEKLVEIYRVQGLRLDDLRQEYSRDVEMQLLVGEVTKSLRKIDDEALRAYYQATYAKKQYHVRHIAYSFPLGGMPEVDLARRKLEAREKAERTTKRIRDGADFAQTARQESEDEKTRSVGGDLGFFPEDLPMEAAMKEAILKLKPLEVSDPVENDIQGAFHVVQVMEVVSHKSYAECEQQMKKELAERDPDEREIQDAVKRLEDSATIHIFGIEAQRPAPAGAPAKEEQP